MHTIKALLFDADGTLLDTREFIYQAFAHALKKHNIFVTREEVVPLIGRPLTECYQILSGMELVDHFFEFHREFQKANLHLSKAFPEVEATIKLLATAGYQLAVVSSRGSDNLHKTLELANIDDYFSIIISSDDVKNHKPDPEPLFLAMEKLTVQPTEAIMIGDTAADILAGKAAGVKTVWVSYGIGGKEMLKLTPDYVVDNLAKINHILN